MGIFKSTIFDSVKSAFNKTRETVSGKINAIFKTKTISEEDIEEIENILLQSDFGVEFTTKLIDSLKSKFKKNESVDNVSVKELIKNVFLDYYSIKQSKLIENSNKNIIVLLGINGSGKTTTLAKLANYYKSSGKKVIIGSCDTFRAAANEQLSIWATRSNVKIMEDFSKDPAAVAFETLKVAKQSDLNTVLIDTAGRLHTNSNLIDELIKIIATLEKNKDDFNLEIVLVVDGNSGQNAKIQFREFSKYINITGLIVTKLDGTAKGGSIVNIAMENNILIKFIGVGEKIEDLAEFDPNVYINSVVE